MKKFIIYVAVNFLFLVIYVPMYINIPSLPVGYKAYVYCNEDNCNQGYVLNVENSTNDEKPQKVEARFLDEKDKIVFTRLLKELEYDNKNISYIFSCDKNCFENEIKARDVKNDLKFKKLSREIPSEDTSVKIVDKKKTNDKKEEKKKEKEDEIALCDIDIVASKKTINTFEYFFRYILYKLA